MTFTLRNTGSAASVEPSAHSQNVTPDVGDDMYRLSVAVQGKGWSAGLQNALVAVRFGESATVPVFVARGDGAAGTAQLTLRAKSESDPTKTATATYQVFVGDM